MSNLIRYKDYVGSIEYSPEDNILYGKVLGIRSLLSYEGKSIDELIDDFHGVVDDYLISCEENHEAPEKAYKGSFNVRLDPDTHRKAAIYSYTHKESLNKFVEQAVEEKLNRIKA